MVSNLKKMGPMQLRGLIAEAKARLAETEPPRKRWDVHLICVRVVMEARTIVIEADDSDAAVTAALASEDCLIGSGSWDGIFSDLTAFHVESVAMESGDTPDYHIDADGKLEEVE